MPTINTLSKETVTLEVGLALSVVAAAVSSGTIFRLGDSHGEQAQAATAISASETKTFGPYAEIARFEIVCAAGSLTYSTGPADVADMISDAIAAQLASSSIILSGLPTEDPEVAGALWNDSGTLKISAGA
jgi:hypothetical protein